MHPSGSGSFEARLRPLLIAWVVWVSRHPTSILLAAGLFTALSAGVAATRLGVNADTEAIFDENLRFRRLHAELGRALPALVEPVLVVLDADSRAEARRAAEQLAERLTARPELYRSAYAPGTGAFFQRNGLLYLDLDDLDEMADRLAAAQPFLAAVSRDPSLRGLFDVMSDALDHARGARARGMDLEAALLQIEASVREAAELRVRGLAFDELTVGASDNGRARRYVLVQPRIDYADFVPVRDAMQEMRDSFAELGFGPGGSVRARITGNLALSVEELEIVQRQAALAGLGSFLLVTLILFIALRSLRLVLATVLTLVAGLIWTAAFAALAIGHVNMISVAFTVLYIGLGVDFGIHFGLRYRELRAQGHEHARALSDTAESVGSSLVLCAITTAIGFYAFVPTGYLGVAELGGIAGTGMFLSLFGTLTLLPAMLSLGRQPLSPPPPRPSGPAPLSSRHPRTVVGVALLLGAGAALLVPRLSFDPNPLHVRDPGSESVRTFQELVSEGDLNPWSAELLSPDLDSAAALAQRLTELPTVARSATLLSFVPEQQEEKRELLADTRLLLGLTPPTQALPAPGPEAEQAALERFRASLVSFGRESSPGLASIAGRLEAELAAFPGPEAPAAQRMHALRSALAEPIRQGLDDLRLALAPESVELGDLPPELRERMLARDGRARVQIFPRADLNDAASLERFLAEVEEIAPNVTGDSAYMVEGGRSIVRALQLAFGTALVLVTLLLLLLWRSPRDTALVLAPLLLAALLTAGVAVLAGLPLNFANVIVLPLLLGIGVDSGIHLVHRFRMGDHPELLATSTPRAVLWSALTTIGSFGSLGLSTHRGMASLGQLLALGVTLTLLANLVALPALLRLIQRRQERSSP